MKIRFSVRREVQDEHRGSDKATIFEAGQIYDLPEASASRWLSRGVATTVEDPAADAGAGTKRKGGRRAAKIEAAQGAGGDNAGGAGDPAGAEGGGDPAEGVGGEDPGAGGESGEDPAQGAAGDAGNTATAGETEAKV